MTAQFIAMEKTIEASELLEMVVETEAGAGARGLSVAGGGKEGLFVKDVLKDSPAARVLSLQEGDQLLSAKVYFDNIKYEDALQILKCAEPYKISFCLKRVIPSADVSRKPGATVFEVKGPKAKMAKLNIQGLSSLKRKKKKKKRRRMVAQSLEETEAPLAARKPEVAPVDVEFSFPKFSKLRKARSAGEVAVAEPSPGISRKLSSLETKRHRLKFPRLKVKDAVAAEAHLAMGLPHAGLELKEAGRGGGEGKMFRFTMPFSKTKKPKEEARAKMETGFQAPQVEFALPKMGAQDESLEASPEGKSLAVLESLFGWPKVEAAPPKGSASALETHPGLLQAGLKLPAAEVAAPKVDVDLALPRLECAAPEAAPKREGLRIKVPKFGISAEEAELKLPLMKAPALGESQKNVFEDQLRPGEAVPSLGITAPSVDLELPFPKGKKGMESHEILGKVSLVSLPQLGSKAQEGGAGKLPRVEVSKADKMRGSVIQMPGLEISPREQPLESQEAAGVAGATQVKLPEVRVPSLDISTPKVQNMHLCKALGEPAAPSGRAKPKEAAEGAGFKLQMPQISLPKFDFPVKAVPSPPSVQVKMLKPERDPGTKVSLPKVDVDLALPRLECAAPEAAPKGGLRIKVPKFGISAEEAELKLPLMKAPALGESQKNVFEDQLRPGEAVPSLGITAPSVDLELPFPKGKKGMESHEILGKVSLVSLPQLGSKAQEGGAGKLPRVEVSKADKMRGSVIQMPGLEISPREQPLESQEAAGVAGATQVKLPEVRVPSLDISTPKVQNMHLCKALGEPAAPSGRAKPKEAAEGAGFKLQMPQISLPKFDFPVKAVPSPPSVQVKMLKPERDPGTKVSLPKVDVSLLAMKVPGVQLPKVPKPELGISVERPEVEMTAPPAPQSFSSATVPALDIQLPKVGVELDLAKRERDVSKQGAKAQEATLETLSKDLEVEISLPKCVVSQPELEPGMRSIEGLALAGMVAKFPKVDLAFEKQPADAEGTKTDLEGAKMKLPTVEIPPISLPEMTTDSQVKAKTSRFALSKFSISGPKVWSKMSPDVLVSGVEGREAADLGTKLKLPKFGISFPKSKWEAEAEDAKLALEIEGEVPKERLGKTTESRMKLPTVEVDIGYPQGMEGCSDGDREGTSPELLGVQFKGPKLSLPSFGGKGKEEEWGALESEEVKLQGSKGGLTGQPEPRMLEKDAKASKFRIASFGLMRREVEAKAKKVPGSPKEKPKGPFGKMPQLKLSSLKAQGERRKVHLLAPELDEKVLPQVELPKLAPRAKTGLIPEPESPGFRVQVPSVEIAVPSSKAEGEATVDKLAGDAAKVEFQQQEGELKRPRAPPIQVSAPTLELDVGLPMAGKEEGILQAAPGTSAIIKLPKVELAKLGKGEVEEAEAAVQFLGKEGEKDLEGMAEASALGTKVRLPKVDISLPKAWLPEVELPPAKVDLGLEGPEAKFKMPSMELPKLSAPKTKAPELELDMGLDGGGVMPKVTVGTPSVKWPKFGSLGSAGEGQGEEDLAQIPQLELKPPKFRGRTDALDSETGMKEGQLKVPTLPLGLGKLETEAGTETEESRFRLKLPLLSVSKPEAELSLDTQPLCCLADEAVPAFRMPQIALPDVGFSGDQERGEEAKAAGATDLERGLEGMLKMPKIGITACGAVDTKWATGSAICPSQRGAGRGEPEGKKSVFKVPGLEISAPSLKTHAEYEVGAPHTRQRGSLDLEGAGKEGWKPTDGHSDAGKRHRVKIPTFGLFLPRVGLEAPEGLVGKEAETKGGFLALGSAKEKEGSAGLLAREEESQAKAAKLKLRPPFGVSLSRPKWATELNGEAEEEASSRLKVPKLGFSKAEGPAQLQGERVEVLLQDGVSKLGKIPLPQVELLSPSKGAETDPELSLKLVKADEAKEEAHCSATALKAAKFKPPRIALSGFKKRNGELAPEAVTAPRPQAGGTSLKTTTKGEPSSKFRFPKLALSSRSQEVLEISEHQQDQGGGNFRLPAVAFSAESGPEEGGAPPRKPMEKAAL
ncbi:periaxin [Ahaetulla prasina]|uniref:periaxin n=1 Tax=Ahaetulla prasina TaxID=499056 RepID=UPI00264820D1|nr:periaxin [Ahaetulla prasina]